MFDERAWRPRERWIERDRAPGPWRELGGNPLLGAVMRAWDTGVVLRRTRGREVRAAEVGGRRLALKAVAGDEPRDWWYERVRGAPRDPANREARVLALARRAGAAVPRPILVLAEPCSRLRPPRPGEGARSLLVLEWVEHDTHLARALGAADPAQRRRLARALLDLVTALHRAGIHHRDLYAPHVVEEAGSGALVLLDLGRARRERAPARRWFVKDLAALHATAPGTVGASERLRFLVHWCRALGVERARRRDLARDVVRKAQRLGAHVPVDAGTDRAGFPPGAARPAEDGA